MSNLNASEKVTIEPLPRYPDIILALDLISTNPAKFHWFLFVPNAIQINWRVQEGIKLHAVGCFGVPPEQKWAFDDTPFTLATSQAVATAAIIGHLKEDKSIQMLQQVLSKIPMTTPAVDAAREPVFSCRVWIREALRNMHKEGFIHCPNVDALEQEMWRYGRAAATEIDSDEFELASLHKATYSRTL